MPVTLTDDQAAELSELFKDDTLEIQGLQYVLYEESEEINDHKHVLWDRIYKRSDERHFLQYCSKSGSYWSDYEYSYGCQLYEVQEVEIKKKVWKIINEF
ncbi:hypothetical protein D3C80_1684140 [compost metagenome]